jgi:hypothetical protein
MDPGRRPEEMTSAGFNVRTRVHEYGGGHFTVHDETIYFSNFVDQRLYVQHPFSEPEPLTAAEKIRFADGHVDPQRGRLFAIREDHRPPEQEAINTLVSVDLDAVDGTGDVLAAGADFYASPALSPDGRKLAWLSWNHPNMPWDGTELWVGELDAAGNGRAKRPPRRRRPGRIDLPARLVPRRDPHFISDRSNWWNIYRLEADGQSPPCIPAPPNSAFRSGSSAPPRTVSSTKKQSSAAMPKRG